MIILACCKWSSICFQLNNFNFPCLFSYSFTLFHGWGSDCSCLLVVMLWAALPTKGAVLHSTGTTPISKLGFV